MTSSLDILLVEDSEADAYLTQNGLASVQPPPRVHRVPDGESALRFLRREREFTDAVRPQMVLLDLNLPGRNGHEVLAEIRADAELETIPVMILSSSSSKRDVDAAYRHHANAYVTKPDDLAGYGRVAQGIGKFWLDVATVP